MDLRKVKKLIELVEESGLTELEVTSGDESVRIAKGVVTNPSATVQVSREASAAQPSARPTAGAKTRTIKAPMSGTFYRAPSPEADAYIQVGDQVAVGTVICIIESMKMMHEIRAELEGEVAEIAVDNGTPVTTGDALVVLS